MRVPFGNGDGKAVDFHIYQFTHLRSPPLFDGEGLGKRFSAVSRADCGGAQTAQGRLAHNVGGISSGVATSSAVWCPSATWSRIIRMWRLPSRQGCTGRRTRGRRTPGSCEKVDDRGCGRHDQHGAGADGGQVGLLHVAVSIKGVQLIGGGDLAGGAAQLDQTDLVALGHAAARSMRSRMVTPKGTSNTPGWLTLPHGDHLGARAVRGAEGLVIARVIHDRPGTMERTPRC